MLSARLALSAFAALTLLSPAVCMAAPAQKEKISNAQGAKNKKQAVSRQASKDQIPEKGSQAAGAIELEGRSATFASFVVQIARGILIHSKMGYTVWSEEKPNVVSMLNAETKHFLQETPEEWLSWSRRGVPHIKIDEVQVVGKCDSAGMPCVKYEGFWQTKDGKVKIAEFTCLEKLPCDQKVLEFWCKHFMVPPKCGFPIQVKQRDGNQMSFVLTTKSIKPIAPAQISFAIPSDYKKTQDKASFYFSGGSSLSKSELEDFFLSPLK